MDKMLGKGVVNDPKVTISKGYDNKLNVAVQIDEGALVSHLVGGSGLTSEDQTTLASKKTVREVLEAARAFQPPNPQVSALVQRIEKEQLDEDPGRPVTDAVAQLLPKFLYFADYEKMIGQVSMNQFLQKTPEQRS
ncbi:hypothetical protein B1B_12429, partial [mine drainage metagenome]